MIKNTIKYQNIYHVLYFILFIYIYKKKIVNNLVKNITFPPLKMLRLVRFFNVYESRMHSNNKNAYIVKCYYNLKQLFSIFICNLFM